MDDQKHKESPFLRTFTSDAFEIDVQGDEQDECKMLDVYCLPDDTKKRQYLFSVCSCCAESLPNLLSEALGVVDQCKEA